MWSSPLDCQRVEAVDQNAVLERREFVLDPNVWSGRALQEVFDELAVGGLASMYPAFDWNMSCSWPSWVSARVRSH